MCFSTTHGHNVLHIEDRGHSRTAYHVCALNKWEVQVMLGSGNTHPEPFVQLLAVINAASTGHTQLASATPSGCASQNLSHQLRMWTSEKALQRALRPHPHEYGYI